MVVVVYQIRQVYRSFSSSVFEQREIRTSIVNHVCIDLPVWKVLVHPICVFPSGARNDDGFLAVYTVDMKAMTSVVYVMVKGGIEWM